MQATVERWLSYVATALSTATYAGYSKVIRRFLRNWDKPLAELSSQDIIDYLRGHEHRGVSRRTLNSWLLVFRSFLRWASDQGLVPARLRDQLPRKIKYDKTPPRAATAEEVDLLLRCGGMASCYRLALVLMFDAGLRVSEVINLRWGDVDLEARTISVSGKGHKRRLLPVVSERLYQRLVQASHVGTRPQWPVVWADHAGKERTAPLATESIRRSLREAQMTARLPRKLTPHSFRHGFPARAAKAGLNAKFIQQALGHCSLATTDEYLASLVGDLEALREALARI